jgi:hypothetical protein
MKKLKLKIINSEKEHKQALAPSSNSGTRNLAPRSMKR